jgi:hypothetical protein
LSVPLGLDRGKERRARSEEDTSGRLEALRGSQDLMILDSKGRENARASDLHAQLESRSLPYPLGYLANAKVVMLLVFVCRTILSFFYCSGRVSDN